MAVRLFEAWGSLFCSPCFINLLLKLMKKLLVLEIEESICIETSLPKLANSFLLQRSDIAGYGENFGGSLTLLDFPNCHLSHLDKSNMK